MLNQLNVAKLIVVAGATGKQGGAVVRHLAAAGFRVRGLTRSVESSSARALRAKGVEMVFCDFDNGATISSALKGADGVFAVQNYYEKHVGYEGEIRQGKALAEAARTADIRHFVQSTMATADEANSVHHFASKFQIENHIKALGIPYTLLGTVWFMDNLYDKTLGGEMNFPVIAGTLGRQRPFGMMAVDDLGAIATAVFANPERYVGKKIEIAGDRLGVSEMYEIFHNSIGRWPPKYRIPNWITRWLHSDIAAQLRWHKRVGWSFPLDQARAIHPGMQTFESFLSANRLRFRK
jgi:uncharacterized protein YbjT (DUF2867 family)